MVCYFRKVMDALKGISSSARSYMYFFVLLIIAAVFVSSCKHRPPWQADISGIQIPAVEIKRYEQVLSGVNPYHLREEIDPFIDDFSLFLGEDINTPMGQQQLFAYITDPFIVELFEDIEKEWPDLGLLEQELTEAFRYYRYHFPQNDVPTVYSYVSGIDYDFPVKYHDNNLIIGLDMFMGSQYVNYDKVGIPAFKRQRFLKENAALETMTTLAHEIIKFNPVPPETLLDFMIYEGKLLYFLDCMFPIHHDSLKIAYATDQLRWAERNQGHAWAYYIENELLYSTDRQVIQKFVGASPFTAPFSRESAPRMGVYNGWQIVRAYMRRNSDVDLRELMVSKDSREILNRANYRP
jgi:hypothetical protein